MMCFGELKDSAVMRKSFHRFEILLTYVLVLLSALLIANSALAIDVNLAWDAPIKNDDGSPLTDLSGFNLYWRKDGEGFSSARKFTVNGAASTSATVSGLTPSTRYYFVATAFNSSFVESIYSAPELIVVTGSGIVDADGDGVPDQNDCNSADKTVWRTVTLYSDPDNDNVRNSLSGSSQCIGSLPSGFTLNTNGPDNCPNIANPTQVDSDGDGIGDACDPDASLIDSDNDGLTDAQENVLGTDPNNPDTDNDGVNDGQEVTDGTNPNDRGSSLQRLGTQICSEWNGFLGMFNFFEHVNLSSSARTINLTLYSFDGTLKGSDRFTLPAGQQFDYPVHSLSGFTADSYGLVCSSHDGAVADVDGRMVHYKPGNGQGFQFAFAMPMANGKRGSQFVPFNTFQPSFVPGDQGNLVANWIQVTNLNAHNSHGQLIFYGMNGSELARESLDLAPGSRVDRSAHIFGPSLIGLVEWLPDVSSDRFILRNVRYLYDNEFLSPSFDTAFQLQGLHGSGQELVVPLDTRNSSAILEIINTSSVSLAANVAIYDDAGTKVAEYALGANELPGHGSYHLVTDLVLGRGKRGVAIVKSSTPDSIAAIAMHYGRDSNNGITYMYGLPALEAIYSSAKGSFNTFLGQDSSLIVMNNSAQDTVINLSLVNSSGTTLLTNKGYVVPAKGSVEISANPFVSVDDYGVVNIVSASKSIVGWVLRKKGSEYVIPTPLR